MDLKALRSSPEALAALPGRDPLCWDCAITKRETAPDYWFTPLHCWRYAGPGWAFQAPLPQWAQGLVVDCEKWERKRKGLEEEKQKTTWEEEGGLIFSIAVLFIMYLYMLIFLKIKYKIKCVYKIF